VTSENANTRVKTSRVKPSRVSLSRGRSLFDDLCAADPSVTRERFRLLLNNLEDAPEVDKPRAYLRGVLTQEDDEGVRAFVAQFTEGYDPDHGRLQP
jgi:hypothetical protein